MNRLMIATTLAMLALSGPALADKDKGKHKGKQHDRVEHRDARYDRDHRYDRGDRHYDGRQDNGRHLGQYKRWNRGDRIPSKYLVTRYYVEDYRRYDLEQPPYGYRWVRPYNDDNTYYLVQVATGLISRIFGG